MAKGSWTATNTSSELVAADVNRRSLVLQLISGSAVSIGIGEAAVFGQGGGMLKVGDFVSLIRLQAGEAICGICDSGETAAGGYQTT